MMYSRATCNMVSEVGCQSSTELQCSRLLRLLDIQSKQLLKQSEAIIPGLTASTAIFLRRPRCRTPNKLLHCQHHSRFHRLKSSAFRQIFRYQALWFVVEVSRATGNFSSNNGKITRWLRVWITKVSRFD